MNRIFNFLNLTKIKGKVKRKIELEKLKVSVYFQNRIFIVIYILE
jgi:hypothetical protein